MMPQPRPYEGRPFSIMYMMEYDEYYILDETNNPIGDSYRHRTLRAALVERYNMTGMKTGAMGDLGVWLQDDIGDWPRDYLTVVAD